MSENPWGDKAQDTPASEALEKVTSNGKNGKEWRLLERLVDSLYIEQRRARRWGIFFKTLTFLYLFTLLGMVFFANDIESEVESVGDHTAIIEIEGPIAAKEKANADDIIGALRRAFDADDAKAVILRINSPGGSPVQSGYVYDEIKRLQALRPNKPVYAVITDIGASGAYYIAAAANEIYADKASLVGSIGVVAGGFGFVDLMEKVGVERRLYTAGEHKAFLDPFSPPNDDEKAFWQTVLNTTHKQFIDQVKQGRGKRLKESPELFSGLVWTGEQAKGLGLVDGLGSSSYVARDIIGAERLIDYTAKPQVWERVINQLSVSFAKAVSTELQNSQPSLQLH